MDFIKASKLIFEYNQYNEEKEADEKLRAIDNIDVDIPKGQFVAILGHNGSGKSTFAKHINALLMPTSGTVWVDGKDTSDENEVWGIRQSAGMVFQNPDNQIIATIVEEDVAFGPENLGMPSETIVKNVDEALTAVSMQKFRDNAPNLLSGGQKQRVAIAGILAMKPQCIVFDEATAMLDPIGRKEVMETIIKLNKDEGITIVLITHYMEEAALADRIIVVEKGRVVMDNTPKKVFENVEKMKELRLDVPQVTELSYELNKAGFGVSRDVISIDEMVAEINRIGFKVNKYEDKRKSEPKKVLEPVLEIKDLTHIYGQETVFEKIALKDVNVTIGKGEFIGLIGHTGSGKSTLIQHLNALVKPTAGAVLLDGRDINSDKSRLKEVRQKVGLVFQYPEHQLFEMTIYKDVAFGPSNLGLDEKEIDKRVREALELVGMNEGDFEKSPFELSGGQKRRVAIAGVLAMQPEVLVLDEPTAGLDPYGRDEILGNICQMHEKLGITVVLVSHSMEDISKIANRILVMNGGRVEFFDEPREVFKNTKRLNEIGLNAPQISILMDRLCDQGVELPRDVFTIDEAVNVLKNVLRCEK